MDIDVLRVSGKTEWKRLEELTRTRFLTGGQIDELDRLYRSATTDLARVRTTSPDPHVIAELSRVLSAARGRLAGTAGISGTVIARFFKVSLPYALYQIRWVTVGVMLVSIVLALIEVHYLVTHPDAMNQLGTPEQLRQYANSDFVEYYHQDTNAEFGLSVWANNAWIALQSVVTGVTGVYPLKILWTNATNVGVAGAVVTVYAGPWHFFRFILPHGLPELTAVFISIAAGLRVFWALLVPGAAMRYQAVGVAARSSMTVAAGCAILLAGSGVLEGFVTPSQLPDAVKIALGVVMTAAVWAYTLILGRRAHQAGQDADVGIDAGYYQPVAG